MKKSILIFLIFLTINLMVKGVDNNFPPFYVLETIMIPIDDNEIVISHLIMNYTISLIFIYQITKINFMLFKMYPFIFTRTTSKRILKVYLKYIIKNILYIMILKFVADLITNNVNFFQNVYILLTMYLSLIITVILWSLFNIFVYFMLNDQKKTMFIILITIYISQYIALKNNTFSVIAFTCKDFYLNFNYIIIKKIIAIIILFCITNKVIDNYEYIGGIKND